MSVVYALATPAHKSAICIFRVTGNGCLKSLKSLFGTSDISSRVFTVRPFYNSGLLVDTVGVLVFNGSRVTQVRTLLRYMLMAAWVSWLS